MSVRLSFSRLAQADQCPPSVVLPAVPSRSGASDSGLALHQFLQDVRKAGVEEAIERVPPAWREPVRAWDLDRLPADGAAWAGEVAFALDIDAMTARELGRDLGRRYEEAGAQPHEIVGAADAVTIAGGVRVVVGDLKTGWAWVPPPRDNLQIRGLLAAAMLAYKLDEGEGIIWHRRLDNSGWTERATFDALDQAETIDHLRGLRERVDRARADHLAGRRAAVRPSGACANCDAWLSCPAKRDAIAPLLDPAYDIDKDEGDLRRILEAGGGARAVQGLRAIDAHSKRLWKVVDEYAAQHPIDLGGGRVYARVVSERESLDGAVAFHAIKELHGEDAAWAAAEMKITKTGEHSLDAAINHVIQRDGQPMTAGAKGQPKRVPKSHLTKRLLEEIRARGGVRVSRNESVREVAAEKALGDGGQP